MLPRKDLLTCCTIYDDLPGAPLALARSQVRNAQPLAAPYVKIEVDAFGDITISRGCFECSCSKKKTYTHQYKRITFNS